MTTVATFIRVDRGEFGHGIQHSRASDYQIAVSINGMAVEEWIWRRGDLSGRGTRMRGGRGNCDRDSMYEKRMTEKNLKKERKEKKASSELGLATALCQTDTGLDL